MTNTDYGRVYYPVLGIICALGVYYLWGPSRNGVALGGYWPGGLALAMLLVWEIFAIYTSPIGRELFQSHFERSIMSVVGATAIVALSFGLLLFLILNSRGS